MVRRAEVFPRLAARPVIFPALPGPRDRQGRWDRGRGAGASAPAASSKLPQFSLPVERKQLTERSFRCEILRPKKKKAHRDPVAVEMTKSS